MPSAPLPPDAGRSRRLPREGGASVVVDASPEQVWAVLTDPSRIGDWSGECHCGRWLPGSSGPVVGAEFEGDNRLRALQWSRRCRVLESVPPRRYAYETVSRIDGTRWTFTLEPTGAGTRVVQRFELFKLLPGLALLLPRLMPEHLDRTAALTADLERLGRLASRQAT